MGCNCGKGSGTTIAQRARSAARARAGTVSPGFDQDTPLTLGDEGGELMRVRMQRSQDGLTIGQALWVTGEGAAELIETGAAVDITRRKQRRRVFSVNGFVYTDRQKAERVAASLGTTVIEVA